MEVLPAERLDEIVTNENEGTGGPSALSAGLEHRVAELADWFSDNPNTDNIADALRVLVRDVAFAEREACAVECERMMMYPGGRQEAPAHENVWAAAKAIRARSND